MLVKSILYIPAGFLILTRLSVQPAFSQQPDTRSFYLFRGKVTGQANHECLPYVNIWNESSKTSALTDTSGLFVLRARTGDSLVFSAIGFYSKLVVTDAGSTGKTWQVELVPRLYDIDEARVYAYGSYSAFRQHFLNLNLPETKTDRLRKDLNETSVRVAREADNKAAAERAANNPVLAAVPILSPEEKQRLKLREILKEDNIQQVIDKKYNREIIGTLTGLKDKELDDFMLFCNLDRKFLYKANQYDILIKVLEKYEEFRRSKKSGMIEKNNEYA